MVRSNEGMARVKGRLMPADMPHQGPDSDPCPDQCFPLLERLLHRLHCLDRQAANLDGKVGPMMADQGCGNEEKPHDLVTYLQECNAAAEGIELHLNSIGEKLGLVAWEG